MSTINREEKEEYSQLAPEQMQALLLEADVLSPTERERLKIISRELNNIILEKYKKHITKQTKDSESLADRIIVTKNADDMHNLLNTWKNSNHKAYKDSVGQYVTLGDFIIVNPNMQLMQRVLSENPNVARILQERYIEIYSTQPTDEEILQMLGEHMILDTIVHELLHHYQNNKVHERYQRDITYEILIECGARYYAQEIASEWCKNRNIPSIIWRNAQQEMVNKYAGLVAQYGDIMHDVFFGNEPRVGLTYSPYDKSGIRRSAYLDAELKATRSVTHEEARKWGFLE